MAKGALSNYQVDYASPAVPVVLYDANGNPLVTASGLQVDTELAAALAAADGLGNPTTAQVIAHLMLWTPGGGGVWNRPRSYFDADAGNGTGLLGVGLSGWDGAAAARVRVPNVIKTVAAVAVVAATGATIWTPTGGKKFRLMGWSLSSSAAASLIFGDNAVGTVILRTELLAAAGISQSPPGFGNGFLSAAINNVLKLDVTANATVSGFVIGTEE
jgi:hypothetical protein